MPQKRQNNPNPQRAVSKGTSKAVLVYFPESVIGSVDRLVVAEDTDRSKWIRKAIREALSRRGIAS